MEQLQHFSHEHVLSLVQLQVNRNNENSDSEVEDEDQDDSVVEECHVGKCKMCKEEIYSFQLCYYNCKDCDYSLHKFCALLPETQQNHTLHPGHNLTLSHGYQFRDPSFSASTDSEWQCHICRKLRQNFYNYHCSICNFDMDIICATMSEQKMEHPSHPHQLQRYFKQIISSCNACGDKHSGTFYNCTTCYWFGIHLDCALLPAKLLIQQFTDENFSHSHLLTLAYTFPFDENKAKFFPPCRVCDRTIKSYGSYYKCSKCRYYVHVSCLTSRKDAFMCSVLLPAGSGKIVQNFKDGDHPNLIHCPFPDESFNLLKHNFCDKQEFMTAGKFDDGEMLKHSSHQHPLILFGTRASLIKKSCSLHDPMKKVQVLCDGCVRPVMDVSFYKCSQNGCGFVLHEWCTRLPLEIPHHHGHPEHKLVFLPKVPGKFLGVFYCKICGLLSNGFAYGCKQCDYYVDINCGFIPDVITHDAHPNHLLLRIKASNNLSERYCKACRYSMVKSSGFHCPTCDFYLHTHCALLLPRTIRHKYDKHELSLRYYPVENHSSEYFCEICEDEFDPTDWFYHCSTCAFSMHTACAPLILQSELFTYSDYSKSVYKFLNVKFGGRDKFSDHRHVLNFAQGIKADGECFICHEPLQYTMTLKCFECKYAIHFFLCEKVQPAICDA